MNDILYKTINPQILFDTEIDLSEITFANMHLKTGVEIAIILYSKQLSCIMREYIGNASQHSVTILSRSKHGRDIVANRDGGVYPFKSNKQVYDELERSVVATQMLLDLTPEEGQTILAMIKAGLLDSSSPMFYVVLGELLTSLPVYSLSLLFFENSIVLTTQICPKS